MVGCTLRRLPSVLSVLALAALGFSRAQFVSVDVRVQLKPGTDVVSSATALAAGRGKVVSVSGNGFVLRLDSPDHLEGQLEAISARKSVAKAEPLAPRLPGEGILHRPLGEAKQIVEEYREAYIEWAEATGQELESEEGEGMFEVPGLDYLEAYLQWKHDRAYPNDEIDYSGYTEIADRRTYSSALTREPQGTRVKEAWNFNPSFGLSGKNSGGGPTEDYAGMWEFMGPRDLAAPYRIYFGLSPVNGRANAVAFNPLDPQTFYIGGSNGGVWKTTDGGVNWSTTSDGWPLMGVSSLAVHPNNPDIVLAGTGDFYGGDVTGIGVMRSTDAGATWVRTGLNMGSSYIPGLAFDPDTPNVVLAVAGRTGGATRGVYRSTDSGQNWTEVVTTDQDWSYVDFGALRGDGTRTVWAVAGGTATIVKSNDHGATWTSVTSPVSGSVNPLHIAASKINPDTAYLLSTTNRKIYKTIDAGATWTDVTAGFPNGTGGTSTYNWSQGWYDYYIKTSSVNGQDMVFVGLIDVVLSVNGGSTWRNIGGSNYTAAYTNTAIVHQDNHNCAVDPTNPNHAVITTDGGAFDFVYNPASDTYSWIRLNKNLGITQFYTLATHPTNGDYAMGGTQDNSSPHSFGNLLQWGNPGAGDGAGCGINQTNPNIQYHSSQFHGLERTTNAWASSSSFAPSFGSDSVPFIGDLWLDPNDQTNVYINTNYLWRYKEGTGTWSARLGGTALSTSGQIRAVGIAPGDSNIIYTGASDGDLYMSRNFGASWTRLDNLIGFTNRSILDISVNPNNKNDILVAVGGSGPHLYRITGTDTPTPTLTDVSGSGATGLPNLAANSIARDPWQPETRWYIATDVGVFTTANSGGSYTDMTRPLGLPNTQVSRLKANAATGYLTAATFGRGMWRIKLVPAVVTGVSVSPTSVMGGDGGSVTVTIDRPAPAGGVTVPLASGSPKLHVPATVFIPAGQSSAQVAYTTDEVAVDENALVTASMGASASATVTIKATTDFAATAFNLLNATNISGGLPEILNSDDIRQTWQIDRIDRQASKAVYETVIGVVNPSKVRIEIEGSSSLSGVSYAVYVPGVTTSKTNLLGTGTLGATDGVIQIDLNNPSIYVGPSGQLQVILVVSGPPATQFTTRVDRVRFRVLP
ncbi:MAG: hypothetical protein JNM28_01660 [Armatimonadetes bacterium]|nr:hypothetical protein [Armatimonadota bacterium]